MTRESEKKREGDDKVLNPVYAIIGYFGWFIVCLAFFAGIKYAAQDVVRNGNKIMFRR